MAKTAMKVKQQRKQKFSTSQSIYTLQNLWTSAFCIKEIWYLQSMFP